MTSPPLLTTQHNTHENSASDDNTQRTAQNPTHNKRTRIPKPLMHAATVQKKAAQPTPQQKAANKGAPTNQMNSTKAQKPAKQQDQPQNSPTAPPEKEKETPPPQKPKPKVRRQKQKSKKVGILTKPISYTFSKSLGAVLVFFKLKLYYWRNHPIHGCLTLFLIATLFLLIKTGSDTYHRLIHEPIPNNTVESVLEASKFTRDYSATRVKQRGTKEFLQVGAPPWIQRESIRAILDQARQAGLDKRHQAVLLAITEIESGFNPMARAPTSSACGLFQFVKATGKRYGLTRENCMNPHLNATAGIEHYLDNFNSRVKNKVSKLEGTEKLLKTFELSYYLHHDGPKSDNPSDKLKAIILDGTPFLLRAHEILTEEAEHKESQPTFTDKVVESAQAVSTSASETIQSIGNMATEP